MSLTLAYFAFLFQQLKKPFQFLNLLLNQTKLRFLSYHILTYIVSQKNTLINYMSEVLHFSPKFDIFI